MKRLVYLLILAVQAFYACQKGKQASSVNLDADYKKGESFLFRQNDSAFYYFNKVASGSPDSLQVAMAYNNMAAIQSDAGDYFGSQESLSISLGYLDENNQNHHYCLASNYNELGINGFNLKNYDAALRFYDQAIRFSADTGFQSVILNNKALIYQRQGDYSSALELYARGLQQNQNNPVAYARVLSNMARTKWLRDPGYNAIPEFHKALQIRRQENDLWGQNASFSHLSDYYALTRPDSALFYAGSMYAVASQLNSPDDRLEALQKLIRLSQPQAVKRYFSIYEQLGDSVQTARNAAKNQFALIRYEAEKHLTDNLRLQKANAEKEYQVLGAVILLIMVILGFGFWYRKRRQRLHLESQNEIKANQLRTSKKVHDVVANGLYRLMSEVENEADVNRSELLDKLENLYERSRNLSYETTGFPNQNFHETIVELVKSFATKNTKVLVQGNSIALWESSSETARREVGHILQELMVNMRKHSRASNVLIKFARHDDRISIIYTDDGIGFPADLKFGNGLENTGNRIKAIQGAITFDRITERGVTIKISFPVHLKDKSCSNTY